MTDLNSKLKLYKLAAKRLETARGAIRNVQDEISSLAPLLEQGRKEVEEVSEQVAQEEVIVKEMRLACEVEEKRADEAAAVSNEIREECQRELDEALPEYYSAIKSIDSLKSDDLQEVRSLTKPPQLVEVLPVPFVSCSEGKKVGKRQGSL